MNASRPDRRHLLALAAALPMLPLRSRAEAQAVVLGTSTAGGGFALYGETLERIVNQRSGRMLLRTQRTRGTAENLVLLREGKLDAALIQGTAASELLAQGPASGLRILFAMYPSAGLLAVPAASTARRLEELRGRPVVFGVRASGLVTLARQVFDGIGLDIDRDFTAIYVDQAAQSPRLVTEGRADALWGAGEGWPGFLQLAQSAGGARFIAPSREQIPRIVAKHPLLQAMEVPAGTYPGMDAALPSVGSVNWILVHEDLDDARAGAVVEALHASAAELASALPQAAFSTLANTLASAPSPELLHPVLRRPR